MSDALNTEDILVACAATSGGEICDAQRRQEEAQEKRINHLRPFINSDVDDV